MIRLSDCDIQLLVHAFIVYKEQCGQEALENGMLNIMTHNLLRLQDYMIMHETTERDGLTWVLTDKDDTNKVTNSPNS